MSHQNGQRLTAFYLFLISPPSNFALLTSQVATPLDIKVNDVYTGVSKLKP